MGLIAGIDLSSHAIDIAMVDEDTGQLLQLEHYPLPDRGDAFDRARWVRDSMPYKSSWLDHGIIAFGIEDPRGHSAGAIYRVQGAVLACLPESILVTPLIPSQWRKLTGLKGNATKTEVLEHAIIDYQTQPNPNLPYQPFATQDAADAYCIATATRTLLQPNRST